MLQPACGIGCTAKHPRNVFLCLYLSPTSVPPTPPKKPKASTQQCYIKALLIRHKHQRKRVRTDVFWRREKTKSVAFKGSIFVDKVLVSFFWEVTKRISLFIISTSVTLAELVDHNAKNSEGIKLGRHEKYLSSKREKSAQKSCICCLWQCYCF